MSYTSPPQPVTLGANVTLETPSNAPYEAVVVSNLSPFLLELTGSPVGAQWLEPFTAMLYATDTGHQALTLTPQSIAGSAPELAAGAQVQATWYLAGEEPKGTWPVSLTAQAVAAAVLSNQGIAGVAVFQTLEPVAADGTFRDSGLANGSYRLWNWGFYAPTAGGGFAPTKGQVILQIQNAGGSATDALGFEGGGSDNLAGLEFTISTGVSDAGWRNYTDQAVDAFLVVSNA